MFNEVVLGPANLYGRRPLLPALERAVEEYNVNPDVDGPFLPELLRYVQSTPYRVWHQEIGLLIDLTVEAFMQRAQDGPEGWSHGLVGPRVPGLVANAIQIAFGDVPRAYDRAMRRLTQLLGHARMVDRRRDFYARNVQGRRR